MSEDEWVKFATTFKTRLPMPWYDVNIMDAADLRSLHKFITSFEELGDPAPDFVPPDQEPKGPVVQFPAPPPQ